MRTSEHDARGGLLVVAAHPDDETVGAGALMARVRGAWVLHVTDGAPRDPRWFGGFAGDRAAYAAARRAELAAALAIAGIPPERRLALDAVDREVAPDAARVARAIVGVLEAVAPRVVVTHAFEGGHPDHDATALAVHAALLLHERAGAARPLLVEMTSYHDAGAGLVTGRFLGGGGAVWALAPDERARKARMLACFASQADTLAPFDVAEEPLRPAPAYDFRAAPHARPLLYERRGLADPDDVARHAGAALDALGLAEVACL